MESEQVKKDTLERAKALKRKDVLDELRKQGVNNLNELVEVRLNAIQELEGETEERGSILVYKCFVLADWD